MTLTTNSQQNNYALIPARSGSKRIKDKNMQKIGGKSLIHWSIEAAQKCKGIEKVIVSTDSEEYALHAESFGALALLRPMELASDMVTDEEVLDHFFYYFPLHCDLCVYLRPTTPFREVSVIDGAIRMMIEAGDSADSLRSVEEMGESSWKTFEIEDGLLKPIVGSMFQANLPNQMVVKTYRGNGLVDVLKGPKWGDRVLAYVTPRVIEIDTLEDLEYARWWKEVRKG